ncbi:MAG: hypothetical protein HYV09_18295 [Deltaproteobacteria bacterium]|nr:hypothetical protein [Deltaproteobacteria bacterium]
MSGTLLERWFREEDDPLEVLFMEELARFEVRARGEVVFTSAAFVEVLRWCMRGPSETETANGDRPDALAVASWDASDEA